MADIEPASDVSALTVQLLSAYLANNTVPSEQLAELIRSTRTALSDDGTSSDQLIEPEVFAGAVSVRKSLASPEHIISLIDGKPYKTLKRHLASRGLTPDEYRSRYNLPASYPMVASAYAEHRRAVALRLGLGGKGRNSRKAEDPNGSVPTEAPQEQSSSQTDVPEITAQQSKNSPATRGDAKAPAPARTSPVETVQDGTSDGHKSDTVAEPSVDPRPDVGGNSKPAKAKRPAAKKKPSAKPGKLGVKAASAAVEDAGATVTDGSVEGASNVAKREPTRRRGKIGLFKGAADDAGDATDSEAKSEGAAAENEQQGSVAEPKARARKRMARQPKPDTPQA